MLFKLSIRNIRRSLRDYAIYFFTLIIGVSIFYVFNAIGGQAAMLKIAESRYDIIDLLQTMLSAVSVFVAFVLGLLIVYASRFLMKRRNGEFAIYMLLGMGKRDISKVLILETLLIGIGSLAVGLAAGIGLSQLMSVVVANLFEADMTAYQFSVSGEAVGRTILYFAVMYLVVMVLNGVIISRVKLIDLLSSGKKSEQVKMKNPLLCVVVFIASVFALGWAYYQVGWRQNELTQQTMTTAIAAGAVATFFIFWSISGLLLRVVMSAKGLYYRGINSFTFRQVSSRVNTMVFSMTVICLMLFVTICALSSAFSIRNSMNANLNELCPADFELACQEYSDEYGYVPPLGTDIADRYGEYGYDVTDGFGDSVHFHTYTDRDFTFAAFLGSRYEEIRADMPNLLYDQSFELVRLGDYNALMELYGKEPLSMGDAEFIFLCDFKSAKAVLDEVLEAGMEITVFGNTLTSKYDACQDGFLDISSQHINAGLFVIPDGAVDENCVRRDYFIANYAGSTREEKLAIEEEVKGTAEAIGKEIHGEVYWSVNTRLDIAEASIGLGAIVTFLGLYIGLVFLVACGAILALKGLSESVDSIPRYEILRKIGVEEQELMRSLFRQTGIFFLFPLLLAAIHSIFGMKYATYVLGVFGTERMASSVVFSCAAILLIYGGYFLITYSSSKRVVEN